MDSYCDAFCSQNNLYVSVISVKTWDLTETVSDYSASSVSPRQLFQTEHNPASTDRTGDSPDVQDKAGSQPIWG